MSLTGSGHTQGNTREDKLLIADDNSVRLPNLTASRSHIVLFVPMWPNLPDAGLFSQSGLLSQLTEMLAAVSGAGTGRLLPVSA